MIEYTYYNGVLRAKSDFLISGLNQVTITREDTEKIVSTTYEVGRLIKREQSGGFYYAWFDAKPLTTAVDNSPCVEKEIQSVWDEMAAAYSEGVQSA